MTLEEKNGIPIESSKNGVQNNHQIEEKEKKLAKQVSEIYLIIELRSISLVDAYEYT